MQVSVESTSGLERKLTISLPSEKIEKEVDSRLKDLARKVRVDGFRPGKVPQQVVAQKYAASVRDEVARDLLQSSLFEAIQEHKLDVAGTPYVEPGVVKAGHDFEFTATFEVLPEISLQELAGAEVEQCRAEVVQADIDAMISKLREQNKIWQVAEREAKLGDKVNINFEGFIDGEAFEGGKAEGFDLELGSGSMIPGFEDQLVGLKKDDTKDLNITFPNDYGHETLAGKEALFKIKVNQVQEGQLPEIDDEFVSKYDVKEGGVEAFLESVKKNMERELSRQLSNLNKDKVFAAFKEKNPCEVPSSLVEREISVLKKDMLKRIMGKNEVDEKLLSTLPNDMFKDKATNRVHLGLLFSEYVKQHDLKPDGDRVNAWLEEMASSYDHPEEVLSWYRASKERMAEIEAVVLEEQVVEKMLSQASVVEKSLSYDEVMNPPAPEANEKEDEK